MIAGFVTNITPKVSKRGPYNAYHISPGGSFWSRSHPEIELGQFIAVKKSDIGQAKFVKTIGGA
jgi:hypothetical protein